MSSDSQLLVAGVIYAGAGYSLITNPASLLEVLKPATDVLEDQFELGSLHPHPQSLAIVGTLLVALGQRHSPPPKAGYASADSAVSRAGLYFGMAVHHRLSLPATSID